MRTLDRWFKMIGFVLQSAVFGLAAAFLLSHLFPGRFASATRAAPANPATAVSRDGESPAPVSYAAVVKRVLPTVVNIYTRRVITQQPYRLLADPLLQRYSGITLAPAQQRPEVILGSGVIVRNDGYVLTNHHVIAGADDVLVGLIDGRTTVAQLVGSDPDTDLAVLKIDAGLWPSARFPTANHTLEVGDVVLTIGNAFGQGQAVTQGIVSAIGRRALSLSRFEDFIQTDAAIDSGNSGGALVTADGTLVGINTAVSGKGTGQGTGISFAIPAQTAQRVLEEIIAHGRVIRGWMGAEYADAPLALRPTEVGPRGVQIFTVAPGSPAAQAGLQAGDVLYRFNGQDINDESDLRRREAALQPGSKTSVEGQRAGLPFKLDLTLIERGNAG